MLEHGLSALATLWLQSGFIAACGLVTARFVQKRNATLAAAVLRATWLGVALCLVLSATSFGSLQSHRALWSVELPTTSVQTASAPTVPLQADSLLTTEPTTATAIEPLPSTSPQTTIAAPTNPDPDERASSSTRSLTETGDAAPVQTPAPLSAAAPSVAAASPLKSVSILGVLLALWLAGSAALLLRTTFCAWQMRRVVRTSTRIEDGAWRNELRQLCALLQVREPLLLRSDLARSPFLTGLWRPCIVLPCGDFGTAQRFVLLHELTHLQRRDLWWNSASRVLCALLWMQPLLWILQRTSERIGEEVCDETVVSQGESARQYAQCLLDLAQSWKPTRGERTIGAGVVPLRSGLARRIQNILDESRRRTMTVSRRAHWIIGVSTLGIVGLSLSLVAVEARPTVSAESSTRNVDASSPEGVVRAFASALNEKDLDEAARYVEGGAPLVNREVQAQVAAAKFSVAVSDLKTKITGTTAIVTFGETTTNFGNRSGNPETKVRATTLSLRQSNGAWKIMPAIFRSSRPTLNASLLQGATETLSPRFKSKITTWAKNRGRASIVGRMLDDNGRPVQGARIHITMISEDILRQFGGRNIVYQMEHINIEPRVRALFNQYVQTGRDGTFRVDGLTSALYDLSPFPIPERRIPRLIPTGALHIAAREGSSTRSPNLKMSTGVVVSVRVVDNATRKPLPGVDVALAELPTSSQQKRLLRTFGKTDANGRALLSSLRGRAQVMLISNEFKPLNGLYIVSNGVPYLALPKAGEKAPRPITSSYAIGQNVLVSRDKPNEVVFELQRYVNPRTASSSDIRAVNQADALKKWAKNRGAAEIIGRVVREDGKPAANIPVSVQMTDRAAIKELSSDPTMTLMAGNVPTTLRDLFFQNSKTDEDGNFKIRGLTTARYQISAYFGKRAGFRDTIPVPEWVALNSPVVAARERSSTRSPEITLTSGGLMNVQIVDDATDKPLPLVFLVVQSWPGNAQKPSSYNSTNAEGRAVFRVNPGEVRIFMGVASAPGAKNSVVASSGKFYNLRPAKVLGGKIPPAIFGGTIATVTKDQTANVQIRLKTYVAPIPKPTPPVRPLTRADGVMTGRVVYENGRPASNIRVSAVMQKAARWEVLRSARLDNGNFSEPASARRWEQVRDRVEQTVLTQSDGTFRFAGLTTAPYNIYVNNTDDRFFLGATSPWVAKAVEGAWARDGQTVRRVQPLVLTRGSLVRGRVLDNKSGQPLGGVKLAYHGPQNPESSESVIFISSDAKGRFAMRIAPGSTGIYVAGPSINNGSFVYADTRSRALAYRIRTSRGPYGVEGRMQYNVDNEPLKSLKGWGDRIRIQANNGQTRNVTIRLRRLLPAPNKQ